MAGLFAVKLRLEHHQVLNRMFNGGSIYQRQNRLSGWLIYTLPCTSMWSPVSVKLQKSFNFNRQYPKLYSQYQKEKSWKANYKKAVVFGATFTVVVAGFVFMKNKLYSADVNINKNENTDSLHLSHGSPVVNSAFKCVGEEIPGLHTYSADEVREHDNPDSRIWVTYKSGVYDISNFVDKHPGGEKILMAAGGALEPFWELYAVHKTPQVLKILEEYRIGNLNIKDRGLSTENMDDPYASDPLRHPILKPSSVKPFNAEPPLELLIEKFITPNEIFFVRNHLPVPEVDPGSYELEICGMGIKPVYLKLDDLKTKFPKHSVTSTIQCAGNRRSELNKIKEVKGLNWGSAAISTAEWSGVRLVDVLRYAGINFDDPDIQHIQFEGLDTDPANMPYGASILAERAFDVKNEVLLAYEMNNQPLPRDHGYPVRVIVPGVVGARNVKWLGRIIVSKEESASHWQQNDYKGFSPSITWENVDFTKSPAIQELPVNSAICKPTNDSSVTLENECIKTAGYAWSGGGKKIIRVDVSSDGGKTWHDATLLQDKSPLNRSWAWTLWAVDIPVPKEVTSGSEVQIICKAVDASYNVQPDTFTYIWNLRGVLGNAWHRISVKVK